MDSIKLPSMAAPIGDRESPSQRLEAAGRDPHQHAPTRQRANRISEQVERRSAGILDEACGNRVGAAVHGRATRSEARHARVAGPALPPDHDGASHARESLRSRS